MADRSDLTGTPAPSGAGAAPPLACSTFRLGYADTDPAGILYYAAWFPWMERLQTAWFADNGLRQDTLKDRFGFWTVNAHTECDYLVAVELLDEIRLELRVGQIRSSAFRMEHTMWRTRDEVQVARAAMDLVTVTPEGHATRIPPLLRNHLTAWSGGQTLPPADRTATWSPDSDG